MIKMDSWKLLLLQLLIIGLVASGKQKYFITNRI